MLSRVGIKNNVSFGEALNTQELAEYKAVREKARGLIGQQDKSILIVHDACLPQNAQNNTGLGHLTSEESGRYVDLMKAYLGINTIETLPPGHQNPIYKQDNGQTLYSAYTSTSLSLGEHQINLKLLATPEYGEILKPQEFDDVVKANTTENLIRNIKPNEQEKAFISKETIANFENVMQDNSPHEKALKKAFERFQASSDPKIVEMKKQFQSYKTENKDWLEPKGIFEILRKKHNSIEYKNWHDETDKNLYNPDFDATKAQARRTEILQNPHNAKEIEFYNFKQFLADEHLKLSRETLNKKGVRLFGDCPIGFSKDEEWAYPKAFAPHGERICDEDWNLRALNYDTLKTNGSDSQKLLKRKVGLFAKRYDSIRFDVSWGYITPIIIPRGLKAKDSPRKEQGRSVIDLIEQTVKEVKGQNFNTKDLIHEVEASSEDFQAFENDKLIAPLQNITKVYGSTHMNDTHNAWAYNEGFLRRGFGEDNFVIGVRNHDPEPLSAVAASAERRQEQGTILARVLGLDETTLANDEIEFTKAKLAEPVAAKNNMIFYMDIPGRKERFDSQTENRGINYRYKITDSFESEYHKSLQEGRGFNMMDSLAKIFKAKKLDEQHPEVYQSIIKFRDKLAKVGVTTEAEANKLLPSPPPVPPSGKNKLLIAGAAILALAGGVFAYTRITPTPTAKESKSALKMTPPKVKIPIRAKTEKS